MPRANIRRPEKALSPRFVETVTKPGKYFDGHGLFLRVTKNGAKQWVQRITIRGKRRELGLGSPPAVSLAEARKAALENRGKAMQGGDPLAEKREAQAGLTFADAVEKYADAKLHEFRNPKDRKRWRTVFDTYALPTLGRKDVADITVQDVLRVLEPIWQDKTETAKRLRGRIENVLSGTARATIRPGGKVTCRKSCPSLRGWRNRPISPPLRWATWRIGGQHWPSVTGWPRRRCNSSR
jgi:hypothetical protein